MDSGSIARRMHPRLERRRRMLLLEKRWHEQEVAQECRVTTCPLGLEDRKSIGPTDPSHPPKKGPLRSPSASTAVRLPRLRYGDERRIVVNINQGTTNRLCFFNS